MAKDFKFHYRFEIATCSRLFRFYSTEFFAKLQVKSKKLPTCNLLSGIKVP